MDLLDKKNWPGALINPTISKGAKEMARRGIDGTWIESAEEKTLRVAFDNSHSFKEGDQVLIVGGHMVLKPGYDQIGTIIRTKTDKTTGCCIRAKFGGVGINFTRPKEELIIVTEIAKLLYA